MNDMQRDITELGEQLWPDAHALRPRGHDRAGTGRRTARRRGLEVVLTIGVAALVIAGLTAALTLGRQQASRAAHPAPPRPTAVTASATAAQLAAGHWSTLPAAPIPPRHQASVVWTGTEMLVWGGVTEAGGEHYLNDGAAYNPATGRWRVLATGPLVARVGQAAVWDGREMLVWGGMERPSPPQNAADGAAYDPHTDSWRTLAPSPLTARTDALAAWTGAEMVVIGGMPATATDGWDSLHEGAAYDPSRDSWTLIASPPVPVGHGIRWDAAVQAGSELVAWSDWATTTSCGAGCTTTASGTDLFALDETTGAWRLMPPAPGALKGAEQVVWTGSVVFVRGGRWCGGCLGPARPTQAALYDPRVNSWTPVTSDPLAWGGAVPAAWTGDALFSLNWGTTVGGPSGMAPGDASAWDPRGGWVPLPRAPDECAGPALWTGTAVLVYGCSGTSDAISDPGGLAFVAGK